MKCKMKEKKQVKKILMIGVMFIIALIILWKAFAVSKTSVFMEKETHDGAENLQGYPVTIDSCRINGESGRITARISAEAVPESDDEYYYLFALPPYEEEIAGDDAFLVKEHKDRQAEFHMEADIFCKFVVAVKREDRYVGVSAPHYVTNPEEMAIFKYNGKRPSSKKGLLIDPDKLMSPELDDLGIKHAAYNIPVSRLLECSGDDSYPDIHFKYNGKDYVFNGRVMAEYDLIFRTLTEKGIEITAIILNDYSEEYPWMIHPLSISGVGKPPYYAFNASDEKGAEYLAAIGSFLVGRYSGAMNGRGMVANWVISNEINARKEWNYMEHVDLELYVREYARAYRIFYNAVKSVNSACGVYISLDNQWNRINILTQSYKAKDVLDEFNRQIKKEGNIDWGLAIHPYNKPLSRPYTWKSSIYVKNTEKTPVVTMANIHVVTDYMQKEEFLTEEGEVRSIILSELGYTSSKGEEIQAAAIAYAYKAAEANPHIDSILFSRQTDAKEEIERLHLHLGINYADGSHKYAYDVYKYMDTDKAEEYMEFAKEIIGIGDWEEIINR